MALILSCIRVKEAKRRVAEVGEVREWQELSSWQLTSEAWPRYLFGRLQVMVEECRLARGRTPGGLPQKEWAKSEKSVEMMEKKDAGKRSSGGLGGTSERV